jgi:hypothetical protein
MAIGSNSEGAAARCRSLRGAAAVALAASLALTAACSSSGTRTGSALVPGYGMIFGLAPIRPGTELGLLYVGLTNRSHSPVTVTSVTSVGRGIGSVVKIVQVKIAPADDNKGVPGSTACGRPIFCGHLEGRTGATGLTTPESPLRPCRCSLTASTPSQVGQRANAPLTSNASSPTYRLFRAPASLDTE